MPDTLKILILEDRASDAELMVHTLKRAGFAPSAVIVDTKEAFLANLSPDLDVILAGYSLPQFTGRDALHLVQNRCPSVPFIIVTGTLSDDEAAAMYHEGMADFLLKDRLARLPFSVRKAIAAKKNVHRKLNVLILEDQPEDAELMVHELKRAGFVPSVVRVDTKETFLAALTPHIDIILADYCLNNLILIHNTYTSSCLPYLA